MQVALVGSSINLWMGQCDMVALKAGDPDFMAQEASSNLVSSNSFFYHVWRGNRSVVPEHQTLENKLY